MTEQDAVREFHRRYPTGVTVVTTSDGNEPRGLAVNAFTSLAIDPPLVIVCIQKTAVTYEKLFASDYFAVNVLAADQADVAGVFAKSGGDKFAQIAWAPGAYGSPILTGVSAYLEAEIVKRIPAFTHTIFIGSVQTATASDKPPMVYLGGRLFDGDSLRELPQPVR